MGKKIIMSWGEPITFFKRMKKYYYDWQSFRTLSPYKRALHAHDYTHLNKQVRMLSSILNQYKLAKRDCWVIRKTGFGNFDIAIVLKTNIGNLYESARRLYYHGNKYDFD